MLQFHLEPRRHRNGYRAIELCLERYGHLQSQCIITERIGYRSGHRQLSGRGDECLWNGFVKCPCRCEHGPIGHDQLFGFTLLHLGRHGYRDAYGQHWRDIQRDAIRSFDQFEHGRYHVGHEHCGDVHGDLQHRCRRWLFGS